MPAIWPSLCAIADDVKDTAAFSPEIGVCTSIQNAPILHKAGATYVEASVRGLLIPDKPDDAFEANFRLVKESPLPVRAANGFLPGSLKCVGPDADHAAVLAYAEVAFQRATRVGIKHIVFGSSSARSIPGGFDRRTAELQFAALLGKMAPLAQASEVIIVIEPLNTGETNFINTVPQGAEFVEAAQHPNIRLLADIFHMLRMDEPAEHIRAGGQLIRHVHIAEKRKRSAPGVEGDDFRPYLQALKDVGYSGEISIECRWDDLANQLPTAVRTLREQMAGLK